MYSESLHIQNQRHTQNPVTFQTLLHSEPWYIHNHRNIQNLTHIQNNGLFSTRDILRNLVYSEPCQTSTIERFARTVNDYNYFHNTLLGKALLGKSFFGEKFLPLSQNFVIFLR